jgi:RNA polymerase sigma-70 factor (ECF subfamily)
LDNVKKKLASDYERADKSKLFAVLKSQLLPESQSITREEISQQLGLSQAAVNMSIMRMRRRFREILIEEVSATLDDPTEVEDELRSLMTALSMRP